MASAWKSFVLLLLVLQLILGSAGLVSCAEPDGTRAMEWVAAGCCDPSPGVPATEDEAIAPEPGDGCRACLDELLAAIRARPDRADETPDLPPLVLIHLVPDALSAAEAPRGVAGAAGGCALGADGTPRALRPAFLRC